MSPLEKAYWIYNKTGRVFCYDYRVADDIGIADRKIDFENNSSDYYQTCVQMSYLLNLMFGEIKGLKSSIIPRHIPTRGVSIQTRDHVAIELTDINSGKSYIVDLALDLYLIQSGMLPEHFCFDRYQHSSEFSDNKEYSVLSASDLIRFGKSTGINSTGKYTNDVINSLVKDVSKVYVSDPDADIVSYGLERVNELLSNKSFRGHLEGKQFVSRVFSSIFSPIGIGFQEFNLYYQDSESIVSMFYINSGGEKFIFYSNDNGLIISSRDKVRTMLSTGWSTRSNSLASLVEEKKI